MLSRRWLLTRLPLAPVAGAAALSGSAPVGRQVTQLPPGLVAVAEPVERWASGVGGRLPEIAVRIRVIDEATPVLERYMGRLDQLKGAR